MRRKFATKKFLNKILRLLCQERKLPSGCIVDLSVCKISEVLPIFAPTLYKFMQFSSQLIADAVEAFASLPGIGRKTALRLALHLLQQPRETSEQFAGSLLRFRSEIKNCQHCHNLSDFDVCGICSDRNRDKSTICVVESIRDLMAIEDTQQYRGLYHILGGVISPIEGIGPTNLNIEDLVKRAQAEEVTEIIMAISPTIEGDTTIFYLHKQLEACAVQVSSIARGVSFGGELEYADGITLGRSILARKQLE